MKNNFIGTECIPVGNASNNIIEGCIAVEGGGFRGIYSAGVLDALMENDINMSCLVGVSAGALNGLNYVSGQIGRSTRINLDFRQDDRYVGMQAIKTDNSVIGFSYLFNEINEYEPFNFERFNNPSRRFVAVVTNCLTGKAEYFEKGKYADILQAVRASATLPYVSKPVYLNDTPYLDGGCACKLPYQWALDNNFKKVIVVKNQNSNYRADISKNLNYLIERSYKSFPALSKAIADGDERYNEQCNEIEALEKAGKIFVLSPSKKLKIDTLEGDLSKLIKLYFLGYNDTKKRMGELKSYLNAEG